MISRSCALALIGILLVPFGTNAASEASSTNLQQMSQIKQILAEVPLIDGHNDLPWQYRKRKQGIAETTYYRWRQQLAPETNDFERRCRLLEGEVDRLKRLLAEVMLDKQMLQEIAKKKW